MNTGRLRALTVAVVIGLVAWARSWPWLGRSAASPSLGAMPRRIALAGPVDLAPAPERGRLMSGTPLHEADAEDTDGGGSTSDATVQPPLPGPLGSLEVIAHWVETGLPAEGIGATLHVHGAAAPLRSGATDAGGQIVFAAVPVGTATLLSERAPRAGVLVREGERTVVHWALSAGALLCGRVFDAQGAPASGARIWLSTALERTTGVPEAALASTLRAREFNPTLGWEIEGSGTVTDVPDIPSIPGHFVATSDPEGRFAVPGVTGAASAVSCALSEARP